MAKRVNFSLTQLEYVMAVHKHGHFANAAKACHVTQPTLSMQVQKLEEELGVIIFDRSKKPILLTEPGQRLIEQMRAVLFEASKMEAIVAQEDLSLVAGDLRVAVIPTVAPYLLPRLLPVVSKLLPDLKLKIFELQTHRIVQGLEEDQIDLGILAIPLQLPKIYERSLYWEPFSVLCSQSHDLAKKSRVKYSELDPNELWLLEEGHCLRNQVLDICSHRNKKHPAPQFEFESGSLETLKSLVKSYDGCTLVPALALEQLPTGVAVLPFAHPVPAREIGFITGRLHYKKNLQDALARAVLEAIPEHIRKIKRKDLEVLPVG